jgi:hypothetical protein
MTFDEIFEAYYNLYRAEADTPANTDDEYTIAIRLANEAVNRWANYDGVYWKELFSTLVGAATGDKTLTATLPISKTYDCPDDMREPGGFVKIIEADGTVLKNIKIVEPQDVQFYSDSADFCYFTGDPSNGFTLNFNLEPDDSLVGKEINYIYYKKPTLFATGADVSECPDSYFIVNRMLAQRFRVSRNPYYSSALRDAEDALRIMQMDNNSGNWADPWSVPDRSGSVWGS